MHTQDTSKGVVELRSQIAALQIACLFSRVIDVRINFIVTQQGCDLLLGDRPTPTKVAPFSGRVGGQ